MKRKKAKRKRRKRGPREAAYSIESSQEASQVMLMSAVKEGVTNDRNDAADNGKRTRDDWWEDLLRRTRPHQVEENTELPGADWEKITTTHPVRAEVRDTDGNQLI